MDIKTKTERQTKEMVKETVFKERAQKVLASMKENGMDQLIVSDPASINYLMGRLMNPGERLMVLVFDAAAGKTELVISKLYPQGDNPIWPVTYVDDVDDCVAILSEKIAETGVIGIDKNWAAKFLLRLMELRPNLTYKNGSYIIDKIRQIKTNEEQEFMIEASRLNDLAVERLIKMRSTKVIQRRNLPISCLIFITILVQKDFPSIRFAATVQMLLTRITVTMIPQENLATA